MQSYSKRRNFFFHKAEFTGNETKLNENQSIKEASRVSLIGNIHFITIGKWPLDHLFVTQFSSLFHFFFVLFTNSHLNHIALFDRIPHRNQCYKDASGSNTKLTLLKSNRIFEKRTKIQNKGEKIKENKKSCLLQNTIISTLFRF